MLDTSQFTKRMLDQKSENLEKYEKLISFMGIISHSNVLHLHNLLTIRWLQYCRCRLLVLAGVIAEGSVGQEMRGEHFMHSVTFLFWKSSKFINRIWTQNREVFWSSVNDLMSWIDVYDNKNNVTQCTATVNLLIC